jgi:hypothetical protein
MQYETELKSDKFLVIAHGTSGTSIRDKKNRA